MIKIAHLSDIHIRGLQYFDEFEYTFARLYESLSEKKPDVIVVCGDLYHSKLTVTNEYFIICRNFLKNLAEQAPVIIIPGNHDLNLQNIDRIDAITPVVQTLDSAHPVYYLKNSEIFEFRSNISFVHLSCVDTRERWKEIIDRVDPDRINIGLYHGSINNSAVDNGWISRGNKDDITLFEKMDYALLGDIHVQQFLTPKIAYAGSLRQNNYGEGPEKGYIFWEIENKTEFIAESIILPQLRYFYTIHTDCADSIPDDLGIPEENRIQVKCIEAISISEENKIRHKIKRLYKPRNDVPVIVPLGDVKKLSKTNGAYSVDNLRNIEVQKSLLREYFKKDALVSEEVFQKIIKLDNHYHSMIETDILRDVKWRVNKMSWSNLFAYSEGNEIDFSKIAGVCGIFGPNGSGKTSILDALCYGIFNSINKENANKNIEYINNKFEKAEVSLDISLNNKNYKIIRETIKKINKKGEERAENQISFTEISGQSTVIKDGETKPDTNKNIRNYFGSIEDFNTVCLVPQFGVTSFIDAKGTKRKELFAKFLDLGMFDEKYQFANADAKKLKDKLSEFSLIDFTGELEKLINKQKELEAEIKQNEIDVELKTKEIEKLSDEISILRAQTKVLPLDAENKFEVEKKLDKAKSLLVFLQKEIKESEEKLETLVEFCNLHRDVDDITLFNIEEEIKEKDKTSYRIQENQKRVVLLDEIPNVEACKGCSLACDAYIAKSELEDLLTQDVDTTDLKKEKEKIKLILSMQKEMNKIKLHISESKRSLIRHENEVSELTVRYDNIIKYAVEFNSQMDLDAKLSVLSDRREHFKKQLREINFSIIDRTRQVGVCENKIATLKEQEAQYNFLIKELDALSKYLEAVGKDGIAYMILMEKLPVIQDQTNHILSQIGETRIEILDDEEEKSINILFLDSRGKRNISLASGAEKTLVALALRAALWNVSTLPKAPMLILDEPFGFLENKKYEKVVGLLSYLKNYFEHVIVITHNEDLKVAMDHVIYIEDDNGFAHVKV